MQVDGDLARLQADLSAARARRAALGSRLSTEEARVTRLTSAAIEAPSDALVWEFLAEDGQAVQRGDAVVRLLECGSGMVTASVPESVYNRIVLGDQAVFRLAGRGQRFDATVIRLAGSGAATVYRNLAVAASPKHLERFDVALSVPGLRDDPELRCGVGRTGRVFFGARPLDFFRR